MTDKEIIKALECCSQDNIDCEECPANGICDNDDFCFTGAILDLINHYKTENKKLEDALDIVKQEYDVMFTANRNLMAEVERWRNALMGECMLSACHREEEIKIEAYKEVIDKLKEHMCSYDLPDYHSFRAIDEDTIDEVLKEMVGE